LKRKNFIVGFVFIALTIFIIKYSSTPESVSNVSLSTSRQEQADKMEMAEQHKVVPVEVKTHLITSEELKVFRSSIPETQQVRQEVSKNSHKTPDLIIKFAKALGPMVEKSLKNADDADLLIDELHECTTNDIVAQSARALCLSSARKVGSAHPQFNDKIQELNSVAPKEVVQLLEKRNQLQKKQESMKKF
jgi:hypothetical protein